MTPMKKLGRAVAKRIEQHPDDSYALTYLRCGLDYFIFNGHAPDTVAAVERAVEKYEQAARRPKC